MEIMMIKHKQYFTITGNLFDKLVLDMRDFNLRRLTTNKQVFYYDHRKRKQVTKYEIDKTFFVIDYRGRKIHYIYTLYGEVKNHLLFKNYSIKEKEVRPPRGDKVTFNRNSEYTPRVDQNLYIDKITKSKLPTTLVDIRTGGGKTLTVTLALAELGKRFGVVVLPRYIEKWRGDLKHYLNLTDDEIYIVQGGKSLERLFNKSKEEMSEIKAVIFSLKTLIIYIKEYLNLEKVFTYSIVPDKATKALGLGYMVSDETHQEFHNVFLTQLFLDTNMFIGVTATLVHNNYTMTDKYRLLFPKESRVVNDTVYKRYINVISFKYHFEDIRKIRSQNNFGYSQIELEKSIMRRKSILKRYLEMIFKVFKTTYLNKPDLEKGDKAMIFAGTIEMCEKIKYYIEGELIKLGKRYKVTKYTEKEDYSVIADNDIITSTIQSAGTALDIPNLVTVIQTVAVNSIQANKQTIGRLRDLGKNKEVIFSYIWTPDIKAHDNYNVNRLGYFAPIVKNSRVFKYDKLI